MSASITGTLAYPPPAKKNPDEDTRQECQNFGSFRRKRWQIHRGIKKMANYGTCGMSCLLPLTSCKTVPCTGCHLYRPQ